MTEGLRPEPATFGYLRRAISELPEFRYNDIRAEEFNDLMRSFKYEGAKGMIPYMLSQLGFDLSETLAKRVRVIAQEDLQVGVNRVAQAAVRWAGQVDRAINPPPPIEYKPKYYPSEPDYYRAPRPRRSVFR